MGADTVVRIFLDWMVPAALFMFFLVGAAANADAMFGVSRKTREIREAGGHVSTVPAVPGVFGAIALWTSPFPVLREWAWVPLVLDVGCAPYVLLMIFAGGAQVLTGAFRVSAKAGVAAATAEEMAQAARISKLERATIGCLLGTAIGDALGLASEGLSPARQRRLFPDTDRYHFLFGRGMCSDDTEHACMLAQSLIATRNSIDVDYHRREFTADFACRLRVWLLGLPAGIGMATLKSILKLWLFIPARWSGVHSAGNGPAMRSALLGVCYGDEPERMRALVAAATWITHTDPKAEQAALAVAVAAHLSARSGGNVEAVRYLQELSGWLGSDGAELTDVIDRLREQLAQGRTVEEFAASIGCGRGVTGYAFHTVPAALAVWLAHPGDFRGAVLSVIRLGGDTDTSAAIVGAIAGAGVGREGIPHEWLDRLVEYPRTLRWMEGLAEKLARARVQPLAAIEVPRLPAMRLMLRNMFFLGVVLVHGFRRLLPPY
jgi:ADP-ribosylglycohydrolase